MAISPNILDRELDKFVESKLRKGKPAVEISAIELTNIQDILISGFAGKINVWLTDYSFHSLTSADGDILSDFA